MQALGEKIIDLKITLAKQAVEDKANRQIIASTVTKLFNRPALIAKLIKESRVERKILYFVTDNKIFANELFLKKPELLKLLSRELKIEDIIIR